MTEEAAPPQIMRLRTLIQLMKMLPDDLEYIVEKAREDQEVMRELNEFALNLMHMGTRIMRIMAAKAVKYLSEE